MFGTHPHQVNQDFQMDYWEKLVSSCASTWAGISSSHGDMRSSELGKYSTGSPLVTLLLLYLENPLLCIKNTTNILFIVNIYLIYNNRFKSSDKSGGEVLI